MSLTDNLRAAAAQNNALVQRAIGLIENAIAVIQAGSDPAVLADVTAQLQATGADLEPVTDALEAALGAVPAPLPAAEPAAGSAAANAAASAKAHGSVIRPPIR